MREGERDERKDQVGTNDVADVVPDKDSAICDSALRTSCH